MQILKRDIPDMWQGIREPCFEMETTLSCRKSLDENGLVQEKNSVVTVNVQDGLKQE